MCCAQFPNLLTVTTEIRANILSHALNVTFIYISYLNTPLELSLNSALTCAKVSYLPFENSLMWVQRNSLNSVALVLIYVLILSSCLPHATWSAELSYCYATFHFTSRYWMFSLPLFTNFWKLICKPVLLVTPKI